MIKWIAVAIWMPFATLASAYGTHQILSGQIPGQPTSETRIGGLDYESIRPVNVPMIADGALQGYVVAKLVFTADAEELRDLSVPPHPFLVDEAFRALYADQSLDFKHLERYDLDTLTLQLKAAANKRIGKDIIQDILVEEFNYFSKEDVLSN